MNLKKLRVGFIGLGLMGLPMAKNIIKAGFSLTVYNRTKSKTLELEKMGATVALSPLEVGRNSDVVITMVTGPKDVRQVLMGKNGVAANCECNPIVIDMSTIGPIAAQEIAQDLKTCGIVFLDAPVTGGTRGAESGELTIFVGGKVKTFESILTLLQSMGKNIHYMGGTGFGQAAKLVNNLIVGETIATLAEAFLLAEKMHLTRKKIASVLENVFAVSVNMKNKMPNMVMGKHPVTFSVANIRKDLHLAQLELEDTRSLPLLKISEKFYKKAMKKGLAGHDLSAVIEAIETSN